MITKRMILELGSFVLRYTTVTRTLKLLDLEFEIPRHALTIGKRLMKPREMSFVRKFMRKDLLWLSA